MHYGRFQGFLCGRGGRTYASVQSAWGGEIEKLKRLSNRLRHSRHRAQACWLVSSIIFIITAFLSKAVDLLPRDFQCSFFIWGIPAPPLIWGIPVPPFILGIPVPPLPREFQCPLNLGIAVLPLAWGIPVPPLMLGIPGLPLEGEFQCPPVFRELQCPRQGRYVWD